ncbi:RsmB/NOP family class I SAM-dependent RNA methyltransferase [Paragemmobacter straminiformis]|uniref:RsmB/NOP family class I SAM-dependent RNA methyltransferase n=1 Tax=Paragemmobacter straminiformis TaxID=2045119 RepID=A0A842I8W4_9RHOB|nr:RsmB/NOP family class I SAM-dependent RNA methyltransferase [Gemmobacter straminiformis]MBC2835514.1 RsmB/NOP family class I SAM-dependent RNA methyltransferase [Gemmobacter straminiformis]
MTPAARAAAAIGVLDRILDGQVAEVALTNWGRASRYAGSGDRAAVRDIVYAALRCRRSFAARGGDGDGYGLVLGWARESGQEALFSGEGHAPAQPAKAGRIPEGLEALDCPDWLAAPLQASLGADFAAVMQAMRHRAPLFLRANLARTTRDKAIAALADEGIVGQAHPLAASAIEVVEGGRKVQASAAYAEGLVELQDAASQAVVEMMPLRDGLRVLDYCAGGGGKTLAMAARARLQMHAHDAEARRMTDLGARAKRAGVSVKLLGKPDAAAPYDLVLTDVPCSGSGSWRRDPQGKWALTPERLAALTAMQAAILGQAARLVRPGGVLGYATCSLIESENGAQVRAFLAEHADFTLEAERRFTPLEGGDGFFCAVLRKTATP